MNRQDIIRIAQEVGLPHWYETEGVVNEALLIKFAALIASAEREACANLCEQHGYEHYCGNVTDKLAETIRARGQA